jgi:hypothetical protein
MSANTRGSAYVRVLSAAIDSAVAKERALTIAQLAQNSPLESVLLGCSKKNFGSIFDPAASLGCGCWRRGIFGSTVRRARRLVGLRKTAFQL